MVVMKSRCFAAVMTISEQNGLGSSTFLYPDNGSAVAKRVNWLKQYILKLSHTLIQNYTDSNTNAHETKGLSNGWAGSFGWKNKRIFEGSYPNLDT